jgi:hypothetical protein
MGGDGVGRWQYHCYFMHGTFERHSQSLVTYHTILPSAPKIMIPILRLSKFRVDKENKKNNYTTYDITSRIIPNNQN